MIVGYELFFTHHYNLWSSKLIRLVIEEVGGSAAAIKEEQIFFFGTTYITFISTGKFTLLLVGLSI